MAEQLFDLGATLFDLVARAVRGLPPLGADLHRLVTLTGLTLEALALRLDQELPASAYKGVPGPVPLTDVCPNHKRLVLTEVFGPCGLGWGYVYDPGTVSLRDGGKGVAAVVTGFAFWYRLTDGEQVYTCMIPATGGSDNRSAAYALKGALTNALGNAVSNIGFQLSVYLGQRSHQTVGAVRKATVSTVAAAAKPAAKTTPKPAAGAAAAAAKVELRFGKHQGKTLGAVLADDPSYLEWLANNARDADLRATVGLLLSADPPPAAAAPAPPPAKGNGLAAALALPLPFGTKKNPDYKGKPLGEVFKADPELIRFLAEKSSHAAIKAACATIVAAA